MGFVNFLEKNWFIFEKWTTYDISILFYILFNFNRKYLSKVKYIDIINSELFKATYMPGDEDPHGMLEVIEEQPDQIKFKSLRFSCVDAEDNLLLTKCQRESILNLKCTAISPKVSEIHLHLTEVCGEYHLIFCDCCVCDLLEFLNVISASRDNVVDGNTAVLLKVENFKIFRETNDDLWIYLTTSFLQLLINSSLPKVYNNLEELIVSVESRELRKYICTVNNILMLQPKESDLWHLKLSITKKWLEGILVNHGEFLYLSFKRVVNFIVNDRLLKLECEFIPNILMVKQFNSCVVWYLANLYKSVLSLSLGAIKDNKVSNTIHLIDVKERYSLCLEKVINRYFIRIYYKILNKSGYQGVLMLLLDILESRRGVHPFLFKVGNAYKFASVDEDYSYLLRFCNGRISKDVDNCWIDNKSRVLTSLLKGLPKDGFCVNYRIITLLNEHLYTWSSFIDLNAVLYAVYVPKYRFINHLVRGVKNRRLRLTEFLENKSEALQIYNNEYQYIKLMDDLTSKIFNVYNLAQLDHILQSHRQLLWLLVRILKYLIKVKGAITIDNAIMEFCLETLQIIKLLRRFVKVLRRGDEVKLVELMNSIDLKRRIYAYKYHQLMSILTKEQVKINTSIIMIKIQLLLLTSSCRFYLHWDLPSHTTLNLLYKQMLKLIKC